MEKCAHPACQCMVDKKGEYGKSCSDHCKKAGDVTELRCGCRHPECASGFPRTASVQSWRSATIGSTPAARRAGR